MRHNVAELVRLMLVTDDALLAGRDVLAVARAAERGGATSLQLRLKQAAARQIVALARELMAAITIPVLINDRPDVALAAGAAGVHLGPDDLPVSLTRRIVPPDFIIGASVGSEAEMGLAGDADYWGIGPWATTTTKSDAGAALGAAGFARLAAAARRPCIAIGAVRPDDVAAVRRAGGSGVAVVSGILGTADVVSNVEMVESAARRYADALTAPLAPAGEIPPPPEGVPGRSA